MDVVERLVARALEAGLRLYVEDGSLIVEGPLRAAPMVEELRCHRDEVLAYLRRRATPACPDARPVHEAAGTDGPCLVAGCHFQGYSLELGGGLSTRLCAPHRRELYRRAIAQAEGDELAVDQLVAPVCCRSCGAVVPPQDEPCRRCAARRSHLMQEALRLGALPSAPAASASRRRAMSAPPA